MKRVLKARAFRGGISLAKEPCWQIPIEVVPLPQRVVVPLLSEDQKELQPEVKAGERVRAGDVLAKDRVPLLAPIPGQVTQIGPQPHLSGFSAPSITIERREDVEAFEPTQDFRRMASEELLQTAWAKGLALPPIPKKEVLAIVVTGFHDDPYAAGAQRLILESPDTVAKGIEILQRIYACQRVFAVVEPKPAPVFSAWRQVLKEKENVFPVKIKGNFPQAEEDILLFSVLPRPMLKDLARDTGRAVVVSTEEVCILAEALIWRRPALDKLVTVAGNGIPAPRNLKVRIGTPLSEVVAFCGVEPMSLGKVVAGDAMHGHAQFDLRAGIGRDSHCLLLTKREEAEILAEEPCIRCGWCLEVCPHDLNPARLFEACRLEDWESCRTWGLPECSECGACVFTCPSHIKLVHWFQFAKKELEKHDAVRGRILAA